MNRTKASFASILFLLALCGMYIFISHSSRFCVMRIDIRGNRKASEKEILERTRIQLGTNIFRMDLGKIHDRIKEDKRIKEVWVKRKLPDRLLIEVEEKKPALWINLPEGLYGLSWDREIIPLEEEDFHRDLPVVSGFSSPSLSGRQSMVPYQQWSSAPAKLALDFCNTVLEEDSGFGEIISEINLQDEDNLVLYLIPRAIRVNMGKGSFKTKLKRLKAILNYQEKTEGLASIDLRFKDQVVLRKSSSGLFSSGSQDRLDQPVQTGPEDSGGKKSL
jgi:cell division protein FtsQ